MSAYWQKGFNSEAYEFQAVYNRVWHGVVSSLSA